MPDTSTEQHTAINKDDGYKVNMMLIRTGSVRNSFPACSDDRGGCIVGINFVKSDQFTFYICSVVYSVLHAK